MFFEQAYKADKIEQLRLTLKFESATLFLMTLHRE